MATQSHSQAVKSLNDTGAGRRRFVFKTFSQRIEDIDVNVFGSPDPVKEDPSQGSSHFRDCLVEWRELNTAEDFISFYEEWLPSVQTLPQIFLYKKDILSGLLSRLNMKCRLSIEPILSLIVALSRDLLEDFIPLKRDDKFIPILKMVAESMVLLLSSGADRESEIIEQTFTSWSRIMMFLQKYLIKDAVYVLKVTNKLRFYPKHYIQEFMAQSMSFMLRNGRDDQLERVVRKVTSEVMAKPLETRKSGVSALLYYAMKGFLSNLHSKAGKLLKQLLHSDVIESGDKHREGSNPVVEVVITVFQRLCVELQPSELLFFLQLKIHESISNGHSLLHLNHLLTIVISTMEIDNVQKTIDFVPVLELVKKLTEKFIMPSSMLKAEDQSYEVIDKILQLMICILDGLSRYHVTALTELSVQWAPIFEMRNRSFITFIKELLSKDPSIVQTFRASIISALPDLIMTSKEEATYMLMKFLEKIHSLKFCLLEEKPRQGISAVCNIFKEHITYWIGKTNDAVHKDPSCLEFRDTDFAQIWGIIRCYSYMTDFQANPSLLMDFIESHDRLLMINPEIVAALPRRTWESLIGAGLVSYQKLRFSQTAGHEELPVEKFLYFAKKYKSSIHILSAVADFLDSLDVSSTQSDGTHKKYHPELEAGATFDAFDIFSDNLCHSDKRIRHLTLRILCHYESLYSENSPSNEPLENDMIIDGSENLNKSDHRDNVLHVLLTIEATPLSIATSRKVIRLMTKIQMDLSTGRICKAYIPLVFNSIIGVFHNRFNYLWNPAMECFAVLVSHNQLVWEKCMKFLEKCVSNFVTHEKHSDKGNNEIDDSGDDLLSCFNAFVAPINDEIQYKTVLSLLIKSLQKVEFVVESLSQKLIPLFLKFLGYEIDDRSSVRSYSLQASKGKDWKCVLEEWLDLLKLMHNSKSFHESQFLKDVLQYRLLDENDPKVQLKVLDCLLNWKDECLLPYDQHLRNLVNLKTLTLRDELTRWSLSTESHLVSEEHRDILVPIVIRILVPKVRKLKTVASRKAASMHHRKAVIGFLAELDINELQLFFALLIKPLQSGSSGVVDEMNELIWSTPETSSNFDSSSVLRHFTMDNIKALSSKKVYGFLHVTKEIIGVFDESRIEPVLDTLMGIVVRILASCAPIMDGTKNMCMQEEDGAEEKQAVASLGSKQYKDLRSLCLRLISLVLSKFESHDFSLEFWDIFFSALKPLIDGFKQEGASSEKPSSLFVCFLGMSRSHKLVSLFHRAKNLVPDIFSILTVTTASEAIISYVLKFIENLLDLDTEVESGDTDVKGILLPNIDTLVYSLHHFFTWKSTNRNSIKSFGVREFNIFKLLPKYIKDPSIGIKLVDILLPSLTKKPHDWASCAETLYVIQKMVPMLRNEGSSRILIAISPLLIHATSEARLAICGILDVLAGSDPSLVEVANLLREFNAKSAMEMDVLDYDFVIGAYGKIDVGFFGRVRQEHALIILSHCVHDMSSHDLILRNSAYRLLVMFIDFCRNVISGETVPKCEFRKRKEKGCDCWSNEHIQYTINNFILKYMGDAMNKETYVKKVWMDLLLEMVLKLPNVSELNSYRALCHRDLEHDFFNNIVHLQKHMRARALSRFCSVSAPLSKVVTTKVMLPLSFNMLLEVNDNKGEHLRNACIEALAFISASMGWKEYYALLKRCFKELKFRPDRLKLFLRLICSILDKFHFSKVKPGNSMVLVKCTNADKHSYIQSTLQKSLLPKIQELLTLDTDNFNVNISLVALKLLKLLPGDILDLQLPTILYRISKFLTSRLESVRNEARSALAACLKELGAEYLKLILDVLTSTLKRGFELHVLGYTLNFILSKCLSDLKNGKLDYCFEELLKVAENDILGEVSEEKDVDKIASKMKETRKKKSFETLTLIAQSVTFNKTNAKKLISPITSDPQKQLTPKLKSKFVTMLEHIALGIKCNPTVDQKDFLFFTYDLIKDGVKGNQGGFSYLVTVFALGILHKRIKKMKHLKSEEQTLSMLDPFVGLACSCLSSNYEDITSASLMCLSLLVRFPLPSLDSQADNIKNELFAILHGSVNATSLLAESCIRLLTVLLKSTSMTLSDEQMHMLLRFPLFVDLERNPSSIALSLLMAIVKLKVKLPEIYDLANSVADLMVNSPDELIRKKCSHIFLQFLLDYDLGGERMQQHLDSLHSNLGYQHSTGREAVLEMLHTIIKKFPSCIVNEISETLFLHLVLCLANDSDQQVRSMTGAAIKILVDRVDSESLDSIIDCTFTWYSGEEQRYLSAAAQVLGLLVEVMKKRFPKIDAVFPDLKRILSSAVNVLKDGQLVPSSGATIPLWKEAYYSLVLFEKTLQEFPERFFREDSEDTWGLICEFLLHPHIWLRNISSRLIALYFETLKSACEKNGETWIGNYFLTRPSRLFLLAASFCSHLKASLDDDEANKCLEGNINNAILKLHSMLGQEKNIQIFWSNLDKKDKEILLKAFVIIDSRKGRSIFGSLAIGLNGHCDKELREHHRYLLISSLLKMMGKIALDMEEVQMRIVFKCFEKISPEIVDNSEAMEMLDQHDGQTYAYQMLLPLYKICEGSTGKVMTDYAKQYAQRVRDRIRDVIGVHAFVQVYSSIRKNLEAKRDKRKEAVKKMAVVNPLRNAKRKLRIAAKHKVNKRRKIMTMKYGSVHYNH